MNNEFIEYEKLTVDKEDSYVKYNDELHKYWTKDGNNSCISVTTLIHKFTTFDEEFWSSYKALEALAGEEFLTVKPRLLDSKKFKLDYLQELGIDEEDFSDKRTEILLD